MSKALAVWSVGMGLLFAVLLCLWVITGEPGRHTVDTSLFTEAQKPEPPPAAGVPVDGLDPGRWAP